MKDLEKLIAYYRKRVEMYKVNAEKQTGEGEKAYRLGIAEGYENAADELEKVNRDITKKITDLI